MVRYFFMTQRGFIRKKSLYRELKSLANEDPKEFMKKLEHFSHFFITYNSVDHTHFDKIKELLVDHFKIKINNNNRLFLIFKSLQGLNRYNIIQPIPTVYSFLQSYARLGLDSSGTYRKGMVEFFETIERYHFISNFICGERGNKTEEFYGRCAEEFSHADSAQNFSKTEANLYKLLPNIPSFSSFESFFEKLSWPDDNKKIKEIFSRINMCDSETGTVKDEVSAKTFLLDPNQTLDSWNTEHWFPRNPKDSSLPDRLSNPDIIHNIGNLLLIPKTLNDALDNVSPEEKAEFIKNNNKYQGGPYVHLNEFLEEYYVKHKDWKDIDIEDRAKNLANVCYNKYWKFVRPTRDNWKI